MLAIHTKYIPPTDARPARVKAYNGKRAFICTYFADSTSDDNLQAHFHAARQWASHYLRYAPDTGSMVYGDSADGRGYVFCFPQSVVNV